MPTASDDRGSHPTPTSGAPGPSTPRPRGAHAPAPLAGIRVERDAAEREDDAALAPGEDVRYLVTSGVSVSIEDGADGSRLAWEREDPRGGATATLVYLGRTDGLRRIAAEIPEPGGELDDPGRDLRELRRVAVDLPREEAGLALTAVGMGGWHRSMRHCPLCGELLAPESSGWVLRCTADGSLHFPRTDPAVIMAVRDETDRLLLARNAGFRGRFHSVLAGFVEPGETLEAAVAREVEEEVGVIVEEVEYAGSQPWPFPRSLMLGFRAWARTSGALRLQAEEIAEADWFTREALTTALEQGEVLLPGSASIARALIEDWYGGALPGEE
ncbi:NAD(+) diphosphatase [Brachybacterium sp. AOP25-B2-12]|uniref:NAD(+) diphosphatase n=1 Tax=Brachybacterium sp. AOP25-B2-12 TaxID=3457710 RepID=UPI0040347140